jgi:heptosyltransferase-2
MRDSSDVRRVLVLAPNWLGDAVMALPAIADVRRRFTGAHLAVAARTSVADLFRLTPGVDEVVVLDRSEIATLKAQEADVAILLPNSFKSAWLAKRAGIAQRWGYAADFRSPILTRAIARPARSVHQAEYYQHLVRELGFESGPLEPSLTVPEDAVAAARALLTTRGWDGSRPLVAVAPGAAYGTAKRWLPEHYARVVTELVKTGAHCVLVGNASDSETTQWIVRLIPEAARTDVIDLSGQTMLSSLVGVIALAKAFVSNDSGAMHVASAVGAPVAAIFGPTREYETRPLARNGTRTEVLIHPVWCRPCMLRECPIDHRCMKGVTPERVLSTVRDLMAGPKGPAPR